MSLFARSSRSSFVLFAALSAVVALASGCSSTEDGTGSSNKVTLTGNINGAGSSGTKTQTFGNVNVSNNGSSLHVSARELHARNADGRNVDVAVNPDGSFRLDVSRGSRWVVTVDDAEGKSAIVTFGNGTSAISVRASGDGSNATVDVGSVHVVGGQARTSITFDGSLGLDATTIAADDVFLAANGALIAAQDAVAEAQKAAEEALAAAAQAEASAQDAAKKAEEAAAAAQAAAGAAAGH